MLTELCQYLKNWFDRGQPKYYGKFEVKDGSVTSFNDGDMGILDGQYFRIQGSVFNDGVHKNPPSGLTDETFDGAVWLMAVPPSAISLAAEIEEWQKKYASVDSAAMSPYQSESFGGYSYSKSGGGSADGTTNAGTWQGVFASRLNPYRKL